jgi:hypothetical protein
VNSIQEQKPYKKLPVALQNLARVTRLVHIMLGCKGAFKSIPDITQAAKTSRRLLHIDLNSISQLKQILILTNLILYMR